MEELNKSKNVFRYDRLKEAREVRGYTIRELAEIIGLDNHQILSKYENGKTIPPSEVVFKVMKTLKFPYSYFFGDDDSLNHKENEIVFFRSRANTTAKLKRIHEIKITWLMRMFYALDKIVEFPEPDLPEIISNSKNYFQPTDFEDIEQIAINIRRHWNLNNGPISDITHLFEKHGIVVSIVDSEQFSIDACSKWLDNKLFILVGSDRSTPSRIKFTLAHELGHYLLHKNVKKDDFNKKDIYKRIELEANRFASAFLLPADVFSEELISHSLDYYLLLKKRWQVSVQAMIYRSKELNLINENQSSYLWKQLAKKGWRKNEPYDELLLNESPTLLKEAFNLITSHDVRTPKELCDEIKLNPFDIEAIANLPYEFFNERKQPGKIISLKSNSGLYGKTDRR